MDEKTEILNQATQLLNDYITEHNMRHTPERVEVLKAACQMPGLFSIDQLSQQIQRKGHFQVSRVTLFNNLELFEKINIVVRHTIQHTAHYQLSLQPAATICTVCRVCGKVKNVDKPEVAAMLRDMKVKLFTISQPILCLHGICRTCAMAESKRRKAKEKKLQNQNKNKIQETQ